MSEILLSLEVVLAEVLGIVVVALYAIRSHQHRVLAAQLSRQRTVRDFLEKTEPEQLEGMLQTGAGQERLWRMLEDPRSPGQIQAEQVGRATQKTVIGSLLAILGVSLKIAIDGSLMVFVAGIPIELLLGIVGIAFLGLGVGEFVKVFLLARVSS